MPVGPFVIRPVRRVAAGQQGLNGPRSPRKHAYVSSGVRPFEIRDETEMATFAATSFPRVECVQPVSFQLTRDGGLSAVGQVQVVSMVQS